MPNDINSVSPSIRDFLLNRNLILSDTITQNGLSGVASGLGGLSPVETLPMAIQASEDIEISSEDYRNTQINKNPYSSTEDTQFATISNQHINTGNLPPNTPSVEYGGFIGSNTENSTFKTSSNSTRDFQTLKNRYISSEDMVSATIVNNSFSYNQKDGGYLDEHGKLNIGGPSTNVLDAVGSILTQKGFGLGGDGLTSQFDIRSSLAGRVLGATGAINDTQLGIIGGQQLLLALGQKAVFNTQKELLGKVNIQPFSLIKGNSFIKPDYSITVRSSSGGKILDVVSNIGGYEHPNSVINQDASIFQDSKIPFYNFTHIIDPSSIERNKTLIENTGKGQASSLYSLLNENEYKPDYTVDNSDITGVVDPLTYDPTEKGVSPSDLNNDGSTYIWNQSTVSNEVHNVDLSSNKKSLLYKTKDLFNKNKKLTQVLFSNDAITDNRSTETSTPGTYIQGAPLYSKGSGVLGPDGNTFCRTWTSTHRYDSVNSLQKNTGLIKYVDRIRDNVDDSVLGRNGFVKVSPYKLTDNSPNNADIKKYMFSIENLAWNDSKIELAKSETGNGDLLTGTKGRIMWFPPYGMKFNDTTAVDWDTTKFIGRGEPVYTYNSTERSGTLEFQIIIDYPDYMNNNNISTDEIFASIAAGCTDYNGLFSRKEMGEIELEVNKINKSRKSINTYEFGLPDLVIYFDNDSSIVDNTYENTGYIALPTGGHETTEYGLNRPWTDAGKIAELKDKLSTDYSSYIMEFTGEASVDGIPFIDGLSKSLYNKKLSDDRANSVEQWIITNLKKDGDDNFNSRVKNLKGVGEVNAKATLGVSESPIYSLDKKKDRKVTIRFKKDSKLDDQITNTTNAKTETTKDNKEITSKIKSRFYNENKYFKELLNSDTESDKMVYKSIKEKIGFFQPAFHSITPEGFNSRLTFLQQCTRQGPTNKKATSSNLAFGMPPICILRIGDFYHTKIIINNLSLTYEPLVWDLNPEGVGVQPMIAKATLNFKFIGGSSLKGPINKLQNAVSFNYFANTEVYDKRSDRIIKTKDGFEVSSGTTLTRPKVKNEIHRQVQGLNLIPPVINQSSINSIELAKPVENTPSDKTELNNLYINGNLPFGIFDDYIDIKFKYSPKTDSTFYLEKLHIGNIILRDNTSNLNLKLGTVVAESNDVDSFNFKGIDGSNEITISSSTGSLIHTVRMKNLPLNVIAGLNTAMGDDIKYNLRFEWDTKTSTNVNFEKQ